MTSLTTEPMTEIERIMFDGKPALDKYASAGGDFVQKGQVTLLNMYSDYGAEEFVETAKDISHVEGLTQYVNALLAIASQITDTPVVRYVLQLLDIVTKSIQFTSAFTCPNSTLVDKLRRHLEPNDLFSCSKTAIIIARFTTLDLPRDHINMHLSWICEHLNGSPCVDYALSSLMICLSNVKNRKYYLNKNGTVKFFLFFFSQ